MPWTWEVNTSPNHPEEIIDFVMMAGNLEQQFYEMKWCACVYVRKRVLFKGTQKTGEHRHTVFSVENLCGEKEKEIVSMTNIPEDIKVILPLLSPTSLSHQGLLLHFNFSPGAAHSGQQESYLLATCCFAEN